MSSGSRQVKYLTAILTLNVAGSPYLTGQIAVQYAKGFQNGNDDRFLLGVLTLKHWMGYGVEANRTAFNSKISRFDLVDTYLPQWKVAVEEGRAAGVMCSCE